jgi:L-malate glycosyltransferase
MNILELCVVPAFGGLELYFHRCCVDLKEKGHTVLSVRLKGSRLEKLAVTDGIETVSMTQGNKFLPWSNAKQLASLIAANQIDLLHAHHKDDLPLVALTKKLSKRSFKVVFTRQMPLKHRKKDLYHRWLYGKIDLMVTITDQLKKDAQEKLPISPEQIVRLYYGVPAPPLKNDQANQFLTISQPGDFNIGVFSRLEFQKGQHLAIDALGKLKTKNIPARLYFAGDVMDTAYKDSLLAQISTLGLQRDVIFTGFLSNPVLAMTGLDVLILPSRNEAFGLVLIEAMRAGVAVVGVNAGGVPEIIDDGQTGLLFDWGNADQLASQLELLYKNPAQKNSLAQAGKKKADEVFNSESHFRNLEGLFLELIRKK